ncbi:LamG-like jellyroll fold domain-containing protein [Azospirillum picis]|uniref:Concanavalin A-like lectin/glucanases superfamily protein n=1 Tax=Azospirillum picis TaxID=488438 RepID=A0ABU0MRX6_9PROT|nr:LamG-like jellyroll fold domain-containing protein [Azospirillum picis]MBP2302514.1 hypothetical protein [Azospirillum picis]MDQ0536244.1 hypothetical protein [Azospirillum picis]
MVMLKGQPYTAENMGSNFGHKEKTKAGADGVTRDRWENMWVDGVAELDDRVTDITEANEQAQQARDESQAAAGAAATSASATATAKGAAQQAQAASETARDKAKDWAEGDGEPGGAGSKSAKGWAYYGLAQAQTQVGLAQAQVSLAQGFAVQAQQWIGAASSVIIPALSKQVVATWSLVDCYIYDTRADTDGGAWIDRCGATSWENEPLNTATRGPRAKFPVVALLVLETAKLTIYDALDLDASGAPRLWMAFPSGGMFPGFGSAKAVTAMNGRVWVCDRNGGTDGRLLEVAFSLDAAKLYASGGVAVHQRNIALRSSGAWGAWGGIGIVSNVANAVTARVLPGAPLDAAGLAVPTVAVATAGGVSVIRHDGNVWDITISSPGASRVSFTDTTLRAVMAGDANAVRVGPIPSADVGVLAWQTHLYYPGKAGGVLPTLSANAGATDKYIGGVSGLCLLAEDTNTPANGMVAYLTSTYCTGWMPGATVGAWLCDGTPGAITGSGELVANGGFDTDTAWTKGTGWAIGGGVAAKTPGGTAGLEQAGSVSAGLVANQTYAVTYTLSGVSAGAVNVWLGGKVGNAPRTASGTYTDYITTTNTSGVAFTPDAAFGGSIDNVSVKLATPDRSYKGKGLIVNGTLQRTAANGGDVVAWSGFSASNYLEQPAGNTDLDFTGDCCAIFWFRNSNTGASNRFIFDRADTAGAGDRYRAFLTTTGALSWNVRDGATDRFATTPSTYTDGSWHMGVLVQRGGVSEVWVDAATQVTLATGTVGDLTNASAVLRIGCSYGGGNAWAGDLAMLRLGAYAPSAAQIAKIYADERPLFDSGAKAFLGGTSSSVQSLSYDDATGKLGVGTGDGVSVFAGLRRVDYKDAAGVAVGANLVTDGDPFTSTTGWTPSNGGALSVVNGRLRVTGTGAIDPAATRTFTGLTVGKSYLVSVIGNKGSRANAQSGVVASVVGTGVSVDSQAAGDVELLLRFTATATSHSVVLRSGWNIASGEYAEFGKLAIREAGAISNDNVKSVCLRGDTLLIGTSAEAGIITPQINGREQIVAPRGQAVAVQPVAASGGNFDFAMLMAIGGGINIPYLGE